MSQQRSNFTLTAGPPAFDQIVRYLRQEMAEGRLRAGDRLPTVRAFARKLGVDPNTVARAYRELGREGLAQAGTRRGTFVRQAPPPLPAAERRARLAPLVDRLAAEAWQVGASSFEVRGLLEAVLRRRSPATPGSRR